MRKQMLAISVALCVPMFAAAQEDLASKQKNMRAMSFLVGEWSGEGWIAMGPGEAQKFRSHESVESRLDGLALVIEGIHEDADAAPGDEPIHHALATLTWDGAKDAYRFSTHLANGRSGDFDGRLEDGVFVWGMEIPGRTIRYTITIGEDGRWTEVGEASTDGENWRQFFEMTLVRVE